MASRNFIHFARRWRFFCRFVFCTFWEQKIICAYYSAQRVHVWTCACHFIKFSYWGRSVCSAIARLWAVALLLLCSHISHIFPIVGVEANGVSEDDEVSFFVSWNVRYTFSFPHWVRFRIRAVWNLAHLRIICWNLWVVQTRIPYRYVVCHKVRRTIWCHKHSA